MMDAVIEIPAAPPTTKRRGRHPAKALGRLCPFRRKDGTLTATGHTSSSSPPAPAAGSSGSSSADDAANSDSAPPRSSRSPMPASRPSPTASWRGPEVTRWPTSAASSVFPPSPTPPGAVLEQKRGGWRGRWHAQNWWRSMERYAFPRIGRRPVSEVNTTDVLEILRSSWRSSFWC